MTELTIDELARRAGMTPRNVRAHQTRGLLPAPKLRGRVAYYGPQHLERLNTVKRLQTEGLALEEISGLIERMPAGRAEQLLALARAAAAPFNPERPVTISPDALREYWDQEPTPELLARVERLGHVRRLENGDYEVLSARLVRGATELARLGVPLDAALDLTEAIWTHESAVAGAFAELFVQHIPGRHEIPTDPENLRPWIERLRQLAGESVLAVFGMALERAVATAIEREIVNRQS